MDKNDYLSLNNTKCVKGICVIGVLIHHIYQYTSIFSNTIIGTIFQDMGELFVSLFFFFAGYGLITSYKNKGNEYIKQFPKNRILPFYIVIFFMLIIYVGFYLCIGESNKISIISILKSLTFSSTLILHGWYLQAILIFYILFYIIFRFIKRPKVRSLAIIISWIGYYSFCRFINLPITWYVSSSAIIFGMFYAIYKEKIKSLLNNNWLLLIFTRPFINSFFCIA